MRDPAERGSVLIVSVIAMTIAAALAFSALSITTQHRSDLEQAELELRADALARAGVHRGMAFLRQMIDLSPFDPFSGVDQALPLADPQDPDVAFVLTSGEALTRNGVNYGTFSVQMRRSVQGTGRDVTITATGYVPNSAAPRAKATVQAVVRAEMETAKVFDYAYFINNWGWFYGNTIYSFGNARSNGVFDADGYKPSVHGAPRYESAKGFDLVDYLDDNEDGITDGSDGGIYAGWDIVHCHNVQGMGGAAKNQHAFQGSVSMPNLSDLSLYETVALDAGSSIRLGSMDAFGNLTVTSTLCDAVLGDEAGEPQNLYLVGTSSQPIVLDGPVVVRGDLVISGVVTGQGAIYSGRNVYVPKNLNYLKGPTTDLPPSNSEADTEAWIQSNSSRDFLGLFAAESVVMGDFTNSTWNYYVDWWLTNSMNRSDEDSGTDGIPNTADGLDGIPGTQDDDVLEDDGVWTVEYYDALDQALGLIPPGFDVGDAIPGTGEDIDGDGVHDDTTRTSDFVLADSLSSSSKWAGNKPATVTQFSDCATMNLTNVDGVLYTNHAAALVTLASGSPFRFFGGLISRNESIVYGTSSLNVIHDRRMQGEGILGTFLPVDVGPLEIVAWRTLEDGDVEVLNPTF